MGQDDPIKNQIKDKIDCRELYKQEFPDLVGKCREKDKALCAWHTDTNGSLSLSKRHGLHCFGCNKTYDSFAIIQESRGCEFKEAKRILAEMCGLTTEKRRKVSDLGEPTKVYPYADENGSLLYEVCRFEPKGEPKTFRQRRPDPDNPGRHIYRMAGVRLVLYRLREIRYQSPDDPIILCEGEKDVETAERLRLLATTMPGGAGEGKWKGLCERHNIHEPLKGREVWIIPDNDTVGKVHAHEIALSLVGHAKKVKEIELPDLPDHGDLTDFVEKHGPIKAREMIEKLGNSAAETKEEKEILPFEWIEDLLAREIPPPRWVIPGLLPQGLALLFSKPKIGKSFLTMGLCLAVCSGARVFGCFPTEPCGALGLWYEDNDFSIQERAQQLLQERMVQPRLYAVSHRWKKFREGGLANIDRFLNENPDTRLVCIDTWQKFRGRAGKKGDAYSEDYADFGELHSLAKMHNVAVVILHHERKETKESKDGDPFEAALGSTALSGAADTMFALKRSSRVSCEGSLEVVGRSVRSAKYAMTFNDGEWVCLGDLDKTKLTEDRAHVIETMKLRGDKKPMSPKQYAEKSGKSRQAAGNIMRAMAREGLLTPSAILRGAYLLVLKEEKPTEEQPSFPESWDEP